MIALEDDIVVEADLFSAGAGCIRCGTGLLLLLFWGQTGEGTDDSGLFHREGARRPGLPLRHDSGTSVIRRLVDATRCDSPSMAWRAFALSLRERRASISAFSSQLGHPEHLWSFALAALTSDPEPNIAGTRTQRCGCLDAAGLSYGGRLPLAGSGSGVDTHLEPPATRVRPHLDPICCDLPTLDSSEETAGAWVSSRDRRRASRAAISYLSEQGMRSQSTDPELLEVTRDQQRGARWSELEVEWSSK